MTKDRIRFTAVLAAAALVALAVWLVMSVRDQSGHNGPRHIAQTPSAATPRSHAGAVPSSGSGATLLPLAALRRAGRRHPTVYWAGPRAHLDYEFTVTAGGRTYVRYLPKGVKAGDPRPKFLTVGTYVVPHPLADLRRAARSHDAETTHLPGGGLALMDRSDPTSAFIAKPGWKAQVEVYDPKPGMAMGLILSGAVRSVH